MTTELARRPGKALQLPTAMRPNLSILVNDIHSQLNQTRIAWSASPKRIESLAKLIQSAAQEGSAVSICGGRHAMGGQQFAQDKLLIDTTQLRRVLSFDNDRGLIEVEAGIQWPQLMQFLSTAQSGSAFQWTFAQKQTGADKFCLGGSLSSNIHGRGLNKTPLVGDIESFSLINARGEQQVCSRTLNPELFRLAIGGYGLFGIISTVTLRLTPRQKLLRDVELTETSDLISCFEQRISDGYSYGDFQFNCAENSKDFLKKGILSCYRPVPLDTNIAGTQRSLSQQDWKNMLWLAHTNKATAFKKYAEHYRKTSGRIYWSDKMQLRTYIDHYHRDIDARSGSTCRGSEMISEICLPRDELENFLTEVREDFRKHQVDLIYGTIRLIEKDVESYLAWAKKRYACIIFNLHVDHTPTAMARIKQDFRRLIDMARKRGGSFYLTYHRFATKAQIEDCYPQFANFLQKKAQYDPTELFQSTWYQHYKKVLSGTG